jgi:hypothetical protein
MNEIKVTKQLRNPADELKIAAIKDFLDIIPEEEVNTFFLENMNLAVKLGYNLTNTPKLLLVEIEKSVK